MNDLAALQEIQKYSNFHHPYTMRMTWQPVGSRGPMASAVQGVEGGNTVILITALDYTFLPSSIGGAILKELF